MSELKALSMAKYKLMFNAINECILVVKGNQINYLNSQAVVFSESQLRRSSKDDNFLEDFFEKKIFYFFQSQRITSKETNSTFGE